MEDELRGSAMSASFERVMSSNTEGNMTDGEVDMDLNLLRNLLESDAHNFGPAGPVNNLLRQLGLGLPRPPHIDS